MNRPRDRISAQGLLPRMEARPRVDGLVTYRFHPVGAKPINLGTDKDQAILKVIQMNEGTPPKGSVGDLWRIYKNSSAWKELAPNTQTDYTQCSKKLLKVFGDIAPSDVSPAHCARYLRVERADAPKRANREMALMSNLMNLAVERGEIVANPCKQVRRNRETPRDESPEPESLVKFLDWAKKIPGQSLIIAAMAEFAALTGNRRIEFLNLHWPQIDTEQGVIRLQRAKQRTRTVVDVVEISPALSELLQSLRLLSKNDKLGAVFPTKFGNAYTESGFKSTWAKLMSLAISERIVDKRFTFHDLRAYYVTQHKKIRGALPDLHSNAGTTARVYDRNREVNRRSL